MYLIFATFGITPAGALRRGSERPRYGLSVDQNYPLSEEELANLTATEVEPFLADEDWAGAAVAMADG